MSILVPHRTTWQRHKAIPFLWRARCTCGWFAIAANEARAQAAADNHLSEEEPFPEQFNPDPDSEAFKRRQ